MDPSTQIYFLALLVGRAGDLGCSISLVTTYLNLKAGLLVFVWYGSESKSKIHSKSLITDIITII